MVAHLVSGSESLCVCGCVSVLWRTFDEKNCVFVRSKGKPGQQKADHRERLSRCVKAARMKKRLSQSTPWRSGALAAAARPAAGRMFRQIIWGVSKLLCDRAGRRIFISHRRQGRKEGWKGGNYGRRSLLACLPACLLDCCNWLLSCLIQVRLISSDAPVCLRSASSAGRSTNCYCLFFRAVQVARPSVSQFADATFCSIIIDYRSPKIV